MILSICMIVKNEEQNLRRCLDSLPLIHREWCELIIVDTGSTDSTKRIALEYTGLVFEHKWQNSFSEARNLSISYAKGRWAMVIDADEQLTQDSLEFLERFLVNPNSVQRPTGFVTVRSFTNKACTNYSDGLLQRLFLNSEEFCFEGAVHNRPTSPAPYAFLPQIVLNHFGYIFEGNEDLKQEKVVGRSLPLLLESYEKDRTDMHNLVHLIKTYAALRDADNIIKYGTEWRALMDAAEFNEGWFSHLEGYVSLIHAYLDRDDIDGALVIEAEARQRSDRLSLIYIALGDYYRKHDQDDEAAVHYERVVEIESTQGSVYELLLPSDVRLAMPLLYNWLAIYYFNRGDLDTAGEYTNIGIDLNKGNMKIRWDLWNERKSAICDSAVL